MNKSFFLLIALFIIITILSVAQITVATLQSTDGINLGDLQAKMNTLQKQNLLLKEEIYSQESLTNIASKAATMGFNPQKEQLYISNALPLAIR